MMIAKRSCRLLLPSGEQVEAVLRGKLFEEGDGVSVGDWVKASLNQNQWTTDSVLPRSNAFLRQGLRREKQVMFANVDRVVIVASLAQPKTKTASIDRFLVAAIFGSIPPLLILTKTDLDSENERLNEILSLCEGLSLKILPVSNFSGEGVEELREVLSTGVSAIIGNSGVGKSSLLNSLMPELELRVREVSAWSGKGTHTTTAALYIPLSNHAAVIDTPGMKSFVPYGITKQNLISLFPEIAEFAADCRFRNCRHIAEPDCAVLDALDEGKIAQSRFKSYRRLLDEVEEEY
jgi:ribosome biogenesis GTPase